MTDTPANPHDKPAPPLGLLAELTHRCPLRCPYCSNPLELERRSTELAFEDWRRVLGEAAALGVLQVHLSGGEPTRRRDLADIIDHCRAVGLYSNLITAGVSEQQLAAYAEAGLDHVQLSIQAPGAALNDEVCGRPGAFVEKIETARAVGRIGLPLTVNFVIHRRTIDSLAAMIDLALSLGARRLEVAHAQYYGWALRNRAALMPTRRQVEAAVALEQDARARLKGRLAIDSVVPDYYARFPKPCMGGWARQSLNVTPSGAALPCHAAQTIPGLSFPNVRETSLREIWEESEAFNRFRGTGWMPEPCRSCERREIDWGGCRCQALAVTGDAAATDPVCEKSPWRGLVANLAETDANAPDGWVYRSYDAR